MKDEYLFERETEITSEMVEVMTSAFMRNPMIGEAIFRGNRKALKVLMNLSLLYYKKYGILYTLRNTNGTLKALAIWTAPGVGPMNLMKLLMSRYFFTTMKSLYLIGFSNLRRLLHMSAINGKHHIKEPHYYLFAIVSVEKGAGRELMNRCRETLKDETLFWESSVPNDNHAYYKSFGAKMIGEEMIYGKSNAFFVWRPQLIT